LTEFGTAAVVVEVEEVESSSVVTPYTPAVVAVPTAATGVVHSGTPPAETLKTCAAVPMPRRVIVADPLAYRMSPAAVAVAFGIAVPAVVFAVLARS